MKFERTSKMAPTKQNNTAPVKEQTLTVLKQFRETQEQEYDKFLQSLLKLEQEEQRLTAELATVREKMVALHNSYNSKHVPQKCLSQPNRNNRGRTPRSKYILGKVTDQDIIALSDDDLIKHISKVAVSFHYIKDEGNDEITEVVNDNLTRLRAERNRRKKLIKKEKMIIEQVE